LSDLRNSVDKEISDLRRYKINVGGEERLTYADRIQKREELKKEIDLISARIQRIANAFIPLYDFADVLRGDSYYVSIGKCESTFDVVRFFYRETVKKIKSRYGMPTKKLCRFDPFALCLILSELGFPLSPKYAFLFIDEAQDISLAEYAVLKAVNDRASFNVFGDLKQNITSYRGIKDWAELGYEVHSLNLNYRNTNRIVDFVSENLRIDMTAIGFAGSEVVYIEE
ncbi:MAG: UvrD-helicase domain-containing protein, partial [Clostridia bacterium]|nr:UvrD-helicase domain-containing protein [Clostridia bacterium]